MKRTPNSTPTSRTPTTRLVLTTEELGQLQHNPPGPSGKLGGMGAGENWVLDNITEANVLICDDAKIGRFVRYCAIGPDGYGKGGPQGRLRVALIPAFCRLFGVIIR